MFLKFFLNFLIELESFVWEMLPCRDAHLLQNTEAQEADNTEGKKEQKQTFPHFSSHVFLVIVSQSLILLI